MAPDEPEFFDVAEGIEAEACDSLWSLAPAETRAALGLAHRRIGGAFVGVAAAIDAPMYNRAFRFGLREPLTEAALDALLEPLVAAAAPRAFVQVVPAATPAASIPDWLGARGLRPYNRWMRLARDPRAPLPAGAAVARWPTEHIGPSHAADFARIDALAFGQPEALRPWTAALVGAPGWHAYLAFDGETPIAGAAMFARDGTAWFGFAGTLEAYRGKGAQSALIARRLVDARELGCRQVVLETAEDRPEKPAPSYRNQIRFGFCVLYARDNWLLARTPAAERLASPAAPAP